MNDEVYFWYEDKHWSLLEVDTIILDVRSQACQASIQNKKFAYHCNISKKTGDEVDFLSADKHKSFLLVENITLDVLSYVCPKYP